MFPIIVLVFFGVMCSWAVLPNNEESKLHWTKAYSRVMLVVLATIVLILLTLVPH